MNKFGSNVDSNYIKVLEKLRRLVDSGPDILKRGTAPSMSVVSRELTTIYIKLPQISDSG